MDNRISLLRFVCNSQSDAIRQPHAAPEAVFFCAQISLLLLTHDTALAIIRPSAQQCITPQGPGASCVLLLSGHKRLAAGNGNLCCWSRYPQAASRAPSTSCSARRQIGLCRT